MWVSLFFGVIEFEFLLSCFERKRSEVAAVKGFFCGIAGDPKDLLSRRLVVS